MQYSQEVASMLKFDTIMVPMDGSDSSMRALEMAANIAEEHNSKILLVHVVDGQSLFSYSYAAIPQASEKLVKMAEEREAVEDANTGEGLKEAQKAFQELAQQHGEDMLGMAAETLPKNIKVETEYAVGSPKRYLVEYAEEQQADLIVMGCSGMGALASLMLGSVSSYVIAHAKCPVLTVK